MKMGQFFAVAFLGLACLGGSVALVIVGRSTLRWQRVVAGQQTQINNSIIGERGQRLSGAILNDMGAVAVTNTEMRQLLTLHGINLTGATPAAETENPVVEPIKEASVPLKETSNE